VVIKTFPPGRAFTPFLRSFEIIETAEDESVTRTLLPHTTIIIGFRYSGAATLLDGKSVGPLPAATVTGLRNSVRQMHTSPNGGIVLAKFRAAGASAFFREPLHQLFGKVRALDELMDRDAVAATLRRIASATRDSERIALLAQFLVTQYRETTPDRLVSAALHATSASGGAIRVGDLARDLGVSQDTLEKRFRRIVGGSPKQFASIVRLRRAIELARESGTLTTLALDAGYYDQSHFNRDFRATTGFAPSEFFGTVQYC
jgi:AraC-like DNA-binding protein